MIDLSYHEIVFTLEAQTTVHMGIQAGSQLRGTLWYALEKFACTDPNAKGQPTHSQHCPMCYLMELQQKSPRGQNPPRPFLIRPPLAVRAEDDRVFATGESFKVGMILLASAQHLFPYLVKAMQGAGEQGVGYGRGRFSIRQIDTVHPLRDLMTLYAGGEDILMPSLPITQEDVDTMASYLDPGQLRLRFITPTIIKHQGKILQRPNFTAVIARLLERLQALTYHYSPQPASPEQWQPFYLSLKQQANAVKPIQDNTRWVKARGGSKRRNRVQDLSGFVGDVLLYGNLAPFHVPLVWGAGLQVGKNTVKGHGWYEIDS